MMVNVAATEAAPVIAAGADTVHVGKPLVLPPVTVQLSATVPVNCPLGVMVTEDVPLVPGVVILTGLVASVNPGTAAAVTMTGMVVVAVLLPELPVTVRV